MTNNQLCGLDFHGHGKYIAEGITKLCEALKGSAVTSLRCAAAPECSCFLSAPIDAHSMCASPLGSVDGHALQIDELKGTKPTERIDLSYKGLGVASAIIIASCIKENGVLKELKCAPAPECSLSRQRPLTCLLTLPPPIPLQSRGKQHRAQGRLRARCYPQGDTDHQPRVRRRPRVFAFVSAPIDTLVSTAPRSHARSLRVNHLGPEGGAALAEGLKGNTTLRSLE